MTLQIFVDGIKRACRFGAVGNNADQAAADIIRYTNNRRFRVWRAWPWEWSIEEISFTQSANTSEKTFGSTIGNIIVLGVQGYTGFLAKYTYKNYQEWRKFSDATQGGGIKGYIPLGRDSSMNIKVKFVHTPSSDTVIEGWGKKRITAYALADIATETTLEYFPEEMQDVLFEFVKADVKAQNNDEKADSDLGYAHSLLKDLITEAKEGDQAKEITTPPPDHLIFAARNRGGTTVV